MVFVVLATTTFLVPFVVLNEPLIESLDGSLHRLSWKANFSWANMRLLSEVLPLYIWTVFLLLCPKEPRSPEDRRAVAAARPA